MGKITIFSQDDCRHCKRVKAALYTRGIQFQEINLTKYPEKRNDMLSLSNRLTVPQVFVNYNHIGGADATMNLLAFWDESGQLAYLNEPDPSDPRLDVPTYPPKEETKPAPDRSTQTMIEIPGSEEKKGVLEMMEAMKFILPAADLKYGVKKYRNAFTGAQAVKVFQKCYQLKSPEEAVAFGVLLQSHRILDHVVGEHTFQDTEDYFYRLTCYQTPNILNSYRVWNEAVDPDPIRLVKGLTATLNKILSQYTSDKTGKVDYKRAGLDRSMTAFEEASCELQAVNLREMSKDTKMAFCINLYNLMIKYAFVKVGIPSSNVDRVAFFTKVQFYIGSDLFSFQDLENGILRGNRKAPYSLTPQLGSDDPRLLLSMDNVDCRIHFALNCGATSCPPVKNFTKEGIHEELRIVSQAFCEGAEQVKIDIGKNTVHLSKIFSWYFEDFGSSNMELLLMVSGFLRDEKKESLQSLFEASSSVKIKYNNYDWSTDASDSLVFSAGNVKANPFRSLFKK
ncbi:unnamed protein product [Cylindrotheca closterium]|uniref:DEP domain-containing protein n=1 Tax=Cylindrotheca closterium TaxID=2856 RepID=A0AAD2JHU4_9STRA|nr:unnamed protein product [Cylindrotheca closterium]